MTEQVSESRFYMWRTIFAVAHADDIVTEEERALLHKIISENPFSDEQIEILKHDIENPQNIVGMFQCISSQLDRSQFFDYARKIVWVDGDYGQQEHDVILKLKRAHIQMTDFETFSGADGDEFQFEEEKSSAETYEFSKAPRNSIWDSIKSLFRR